MLGLKTDQGRRTQLTVKALGFAVAVVQLQLAYFSRFSIENSNLLPSGMEITSYNSHEGFS